MALACSWLHLTSKSSENTLQVVREKACSQILVPSIRSLQKFDVDCTMAMVDAKAKHGHSLMPFNEDCQVEQVVDDRCLTRSGTPPRFAICVGDPDVSSHSSEERSHESRCETTQSSRIKTGGRLYSTMITLQEIRSCHTAASLTEAQRSSAIVSDLAIRIRRRQPKAHPRFALPPSPHFHSTSPPSVSNSFMAFHLSAARYTGWQAFSFECGSQPLAGQGEGKHIA